MPASSKVRERDNGQASTLSLARARGGATVGFWQDERRQHASGTFMWTGGIEERSRERSSTRTAGRGVAQEQQEIGGDGVKGVLQQRDHRGDASQERGQVSSAVWERSGCGKRTGLRGRGIRA